MVLSFVLNTFQAFELRRQFPKQVFEEIDAAYESLRDSYWFGNQKTVKPRCFFQPTSADELARGVAICAKAKCAFGVKSGGHGHFAGQSCVEAGVQFDLAKLDTISIQRSTGTVLVGTGCRWGAVYEKLQPEGLMAIGGRAASVGVGGFLLGGGLSFYAARRGWAINHVRSFEVVLANGIVVTASRSSEPDLFRALRGGGSNFGIVTTFELELYPYTGMWGGRTLIEGIHDRQAIDAYATFVGNLKSEPLGHTIIIFNYDEGPLHMHQYIVHTEPVGDLPAFDCLRQVPTIESTLGTTDYSDLAGNIADLQEWADSRVGCATLTFKLDKALCHFAYDVFIEEIAPVSGYIKGTMELHALPRNLSPADNVFGLEQTEEQLISFLLLFTYTSEIHDEEVIITQQRIIARVRKEAEKRKLFHPFLFPNYSAQWQDVIGSFGEANVKFLQNVSKKYDPEQIFQQLQTGSFKVSEHGWKPTAFGRKLRHQAIEM
ncbi:hypothetical protein LTR27_004059 [Elasticomyces elasticus]|nr:hypothetical protein LTR27_004059 [Elasticomyces elasticus]